MEDYRIMVLNDTTIKCFRDGRIFTLSKRCKKYEKWIERSNNPYHVGYNRINIGGKLYLSHRLIMIAFVGDSDQVVDHINRIKNDNRLENLRYCTSCENNLNKDYVDNAKGCHFDKRINKWQAHIRINRILKHLGMFDTEEEAHQAYVDARDKRVNDS
tara:strand:+ start:136 stop:609 length:474 start_codon:yes stop_codon:yes gene_type:complete